MKKLLPPYFAIAGHSNTGKTTMIARLIRELVKKKIRVVSIKHSEGKFSMDTPGKDTWKHREAGSSMIVFSTAGETSYILPEPLDLEDVLKHISSIINPDIVLIEGLMSGEIPKIVLGGTGNRSDDVDREKLFENAMESILKEIKILRLLVRLPNMDCQRCGFRSCSELADAILKEEAEIEDCKQLLMKESVPFLDLLVNGKSIELSPFPAAMLESGITGMLTSLKGVEHIGEVEIRYRRPDGNEDA